MRLQRISNAAYARDVLPLTASLWAGRRTECQYVAQTLELARTAYGRRSYATMGLYDGKRLVASHKRYERTLQHESHTLRALGFGAVFTPEELRGRGYASLMLATALDFARDRGIDVAYLFSDIRPQFYADLGFRALPSRALRLRADTLSGERLQLTPLEPAHWRSIRKCHENVRRTARASLERSPAAWDWIATRLRQGSENQSGQPMNLAVERRREIVAYVFGVRSPEHDAFIFEEYGWSARAAPTTIASLLRAAAGDLRRVIGWLPPPCARAVLPRGTVLRRNRAVLMMAPLSGAGKRLIEALAPPTSGDFCWPTDHI